MGVIGRGIGQGFSVARDAVARGLIRLGVTPNALTATGVAWTLAAGVCYGMSAGKGFAWSVSPHAPANMYLFLAGVLLILASACDMLDGAVARLGNQATIFGGFLDSTLDRFSDFVVYAGIAVYYAWQTPANVTFILGSMLAFFNSFMISYTRARAEDLIDACRVGYWQRGERSAAILIATFAHNIPALVAQQAILPLLTVIRRIGYARAVLAGAGPIVDPRQGGWWLKVRLWRWPRMSWPYDLVTAANIAWLIWAPLGQGDILRRLIAGH